MSVPARRGPWWYYTRTEEGKSYAIHCRRPARGRDELPPAGEPGEEEQILLDENVEAAGSEYFAVGSAAVSHDHQWLAYSTDRAGDEKYELRFRPLDTDIVPGTAPEMVPDTSYGLAWSAGTDVIFYVRMDEAQRPNQLWRHLLGTDPAGDELVYEETDRRFSLGTGSTHDTAFVLLGLHSTNTSEWRAIPSAEPLAAPTVVMPRREGVEYALDHLTPSTTAAGGWFVALTNDDARDFRVLAAPDAELGSDEPGVWREVVRHRPGVRIEDVDAFAGALILSERAEAETRVRVLPLPTGARSTSADPFGDDLLAAGWIVPSAASPSATWLSANPEPDSPVLRIGRTTMVTPSSVLQVDLDDRAETLLKQEPVLGDFDADRYETYREWAVAVDGRASRSPSCTAKAWRCRHRASSTATARTRCRSTRPSRTTAFRSSTAVSCTPSHTSGAAARWAGPGTRTAAWSTRPTPSRTSSPARGTSPSAASHTPARSPAAAARPAAC